MLLSPIAPNVTSINEKSMKWDALGASRDLSGEPLGPFGDHWYPLWGSLACLTGLLGWLGSMEGPIRYENLFGVSCSGNIYIYSYIYICIYKIHVPQNLRRVVKGGPVPLRLDGENLLSGTIRT